jgi:hypothetical protein
MDLDELFYHYGGPFIIRERRAANVALTVILALTLLAAAFVAHSSMIVALMKLCQILRVPVRYLYD